MAKTTKAVKATKKVTLTNDQLAVKKQVSALLNKAAKSAASTVATLKEAASMALAEVKGMPDLKTVTDKAGFIAKLHADDLAKLSVNEKAIFKDSLFLLLAPETVIEVKPAKGNQGAVTMAAGEAMPTISKHALRAAASEIRNAEGKGRASKGAPKSKTAIFAPSFLNAIPQIIADKKALAELKGALAAVGYELTRIRAVERVRKPASISGMVSQINAAAEIRAAA